MTIELNIPLMGLYLWNAIRIPPMGTYLKSKVKASAGSRNTTYSCQCCLTYINVLCSPCPFFSCFFSETDTVFVLIVSESPPFCFFWLISHLLYFSLPFFKLCICKTNHIFAILLYHKFVHLSIFIVTFCTIIFLHLFYFCQNCRLIFTHVLYMFLRFHILYLTLFLFFITIVTKSANI